MKKGFTLLETLFALIIVSTGFFAIFSLVIKSFSATPSIIDRLIAANLAQEGLEIVRNIRDSAYAYSKDWAEITSAAYLDKDNCLSEDKNCEADPENGLFDIADDTYLRYDASTGKYNYTGGEITRFRRWLNLNQGEGLCADIPVATSTSPNDCIQVKVKVSWQGKAGREEEVNTESYLYNWR